MKAKICIVAGILLIILSPFIIPSQIFDLLYYSLGWGGVRISEVIPAVKLAGMLITVYGFILIVKEK